jgi:hypothetical protein
MPKLALFMLLLFALPGNSCFGQQTLLMLQKKNRQKNAYYKPGDEISFRVKGSRKKFTGTIRSLKDSVIFLNGFQVRVDEVSSLYIDDKTKWWLRYKVEQLCLLAGAGYLIIDSINHGEIDEDTLKISGTLIGVGLLAKLVIGNRIKIKGRTRLRIVSL